MDTSGQFSMQGLAGPQGVPTGSIPPEILQGFMSSGQTIDDTLNTWAQLFPAKGAQLGLIKDLIQKLVAEIVAEGAGPTSPTAAGPAFPGGGIDRGVAGAGTI